MRKGARLGRAPSLAQLFHIESAAVSNSSSAADRGTSASAACASVAEPSAGDASVYARASAVPAAYG
jgi:precorrin-3B methylase